MGRPVGVAIDPADALLVADDMGNKVWRVMPEGQGRDRSACGLEPARTAGMVGQLPPRGSLKDR
jgi:hypothetical protein